MIIILGAGIIGLSLGYHLLNKGKRVKIFDSSSIKAKSTHAAVGMLAPLIETKPLERKLFDLMIESKIIWEKLQQNKNFSNIVGLKSNSSLMVALNEDDKEKLRFKKNFFETLGYTSTFLSKSETLRKEPFLNSNISGSLFCDKQNQVNPVLYRKFLIKEVLRLGGEIINEKIIKSITLKKKKIVFNDKSFSFDKVVISCGVWSNEIIYNSFGIKLPTRPLKGISLTLKAPSLKFNHNLWFRNIYIAQRDNGILAVGATEEEKGFDSSIKMDELFFLTNSLWESLPKLEDVTLNEIKVGLRPAVYDGNPIIGPLEEVSQDIICNFGHYRNGILLAPITSQIISQYIFEENISKEHKFFSPKRFNL